jgi:hypothetical protein
MQVDRLHAVCTVENQALDGHETTKELTLLKSLCLMLQQPTNRTISKSYSTCSFIAISFLRTAPPLIIRYAFLA